MGERLQTIRADWGQSGLRPIARAVLIAVDLSAANEHRSKLLIPAVEANEFVPSSESPDSIRRRQQEHLEDVRQETHDEG